MLKKMMVLSLLAPLAMLAVGCTDPIEAQQDPIQQYPQVHVESYSLQSKVRVQKPIATRVGAGQLRVDVPVRNLSDDDLHVDYIYYFYNKNGALAQDPSSRQFLMIPRKGISQIEFTSLTPADDFRVEIMYAK